MYATKQDTKAGCILITDDGFTCMPENQPKEVKASSGGMLYVDCSQGRHYLDGQLNDQGEFLGLKHKH